MRVTSHYACYMSCDSLVRVKIYDKGKNYETSYYWTFSLPGMHKSLAFGRLNFIWWCQYFQHTYCSSLPYTQKFVCSHAPKRKRQISARFTDHPKIVGSEYGTYFMSSFRRLEFEGSWKIFWKCCVSLIYALVNFCLFRPGNLFSTSL
jgi:hypothetical protein